MCQLCKLTEIAGRDRWPKPLEKDVAQLKELIHTAHLEATALTTQRASARCGTTLEHAKSHKEPSIVAAALSSQLAAISVTSSEAGSLAAVKKATSAVRQTLGLLEATLDVLDQERNAWWFGPEKKALRRRWAEAETCEAEKLRQLNLINEKTKDMIKDMEAKLGLFVRWNLEGQA